jgi:hypothetical protein
MGTAVWLELERLLALPLDPVARATLWRELLTLAPLAKDGAGQDQVRATLELRLLEHELERCRNLGQAGEWLEALQRLEALAPQLQQGEAGDHPTAVLIELVMGVHQAIVVEERSMDPQQRAELLWQAHRWLKVGGRVELPPHDWLTLTREQICRTAALAWLDQAGAIEGREARALARQRSLVLLIDLAPFWSPCPDWIALYLQEGLRSACEPANRPFHSLQERLGWAAALAGLEREGGASEGLVELLGPAHAAIEVGRALRLPAFS